MQHFLRKTTGNKHEFSYPYWGFRNNCVNCCSHLWMWMWRDDHGVLRAKSRICCVRVLQQWASWKDTGSPVAYGCPKVSRSLELRLGAPSLRQGNLTISVSFPLCSPTNHNHTNDVISLDLHISGDWGTILCSDNLAYKATEMLAWTASRKLWGTSK